MLGLKLRMVVIMKALVSLYKIELSTVHGAQSLKEHASSKLLDHEVNCFYYTIPSPLEITNIGHSGRRPRPRTRQIVA